MQDGVILCGSIKEKVTSVEHTEWVKSQKCVCVYVWVYMCACVSACTKVGVEGASAGLGKSPVICNKDGTGLLCQGAAWVVDVIYALLAISKVIQYLTTGKNRTLLSVFTTKLELPHSTHWYIYIYFYKSKHYFLNYALYMWIWIWFQIIISDWLIFC